MPLDYSAGEGNISFCMQEQVGTQAMKCGTYSCSNGSIIQRERHKRDCARHHDRDYNLSSPSSPLPSESATQQGAKSLLPSEMQIIHVLSRSWVRLRAIATYSTTPRATQIPIPANFRGHVKQLELQEVCKFYSCPSLFFLM